MIIHREKRKRTIGVVTVARSDLNSLLPVVTRILSHAGLELNLYVSGMHLSSEFGNTVEDIRKHNIPISATVDMLLSSNTPVSMAKSMGIGTLGFAQVFENNRPDILLVLGDRFETHCAVVAALPFNIPIAHLRGGETTFGAVDESFRHSITKMSHLHFVANELFAKRLVQMGEESWRITVSGDPGLETIDQTLFHSKEELEEQFNIDLSKPILLVTFHPVTLEYYKTGIYIDNLLTALTHFNDCQLIFTYPNADTQGRVIIEKIETYCRENSGAVTVPNFGREGFYNMMRRAAVMVGNSSSGIWESASFQLPVVNIGKRQEGRLRAENVIDVGTSVDEIKKGIKQALSPTFRESVKSVKNPYVKENAVELIASKLALVKLDETLLIKRFFDIKYIT